MNKIVPGNVQDAASKSSLTKLAQISKVDLPSMMKHLRLRKNISARELSIRSGLSSSYVSKVESGDINPTVDAFSRLVDNLDCTDFEIVFLIRSIHKDVT
jgi:transcriptional regulator with XRE-family HTH domain